MDVGDVSANGVTSFARGLRIERRYTVAGVDPVDAVECELRDSVIRDPDGTVVFEMRGVEVPKAWSQLATDILASKYFRKSGVGGEGKGETSIRQVVRRIVDTIRWEGERKGYFASPEDAQAFRDELAYMLVHQIGAFNSPVWFNCGLWHAYGIEGSGGNFAWDEEQGKAVETKNGYERPQTSACFIQSVDDDLASIFELVKNEARLFRHGSGTGSSFDKIRGKGEKLSGGGTSSGLMSWLKVLDAGAGSIKSGGTTRRAATMRTLSMDHPDIEAFIDWKKSEEKKAQALIAQGYPADFNGEAYQTVSGQNSNNSVRVTDEFMRAVVEDREWNTTYRTTGKVAKTYRARDLWRKIAEAAWACADPGIQYDTTVNDWHTTPSSGRINASNPCVTGDALVATSDGLVRIDSMLGSDARVVGSDGNLHNISAAFLTGVKPVYRLLTRSGFELKLTSDHMVLTSNRGDVKACELTQDDSVVLRGAPFGAVRVDGRIGEYLGLMIGDGCVSSDRKMASLSLDPKDESIAKNISDLVTSFKLDHATDGRCMRDVNATYSKTSVRVSTGSRCVIDEITKFAVLDRGSENKSITATGMMLDKVSMASMIRGLFTSDGTVADYGDKSQYVGLDSTSLLLIQQVQSILLSFGVKSKIYRDRNEGQTSSLLPDGKGGRREYPVRMLHSLRISRSSRVVFEREIGFMEGSHKSHRLRELNRRAEAYQDRFEDRVDSLDLAGEEPVYDLTEPATSHFVANGIVVHNCSEYMHVDDSACNLASLNLTKFCSLQDPSARSFDVGAYRHAVRVFFLAQEILVDLASYPTAKIAENSYRLRPLGLGHANLGSLLMRLGIPYDSDEGRGIGAALTAIMHGHAGKTSAEIAGVLGAFVDFEKNREPMLLVMKKHRDAAENISLKCPSNLSMEAKRSLDHAFVLGARNGFRNAQLSLLAPTGTIGLLMDCDTTGIEPDFALVKHKKLAGGGSFKIVNASVSTALDRIGLSSRQKTDVLKHVEDTGAMVGAPHFPSEKLPIFDCASGVRAIRPMAHLEMMAAVQPFLSGAISKSCNVPNSYTVDDIAEIYMQGWKLGLKAVAVYRDGCKASQPLSTVPTKPVVAPPVPTAPSVTQPKRIRLPARRGGFTQEARVGGHKLFLRTGEYPDGRLGEIFIDTHKDGATLRALVNSFAIAVSMGLQYGVPLDAFVEQFTFTRFEPQGAVEGHDRIKFATSIVDYVFRTLGVEYLGRDDLAHLPASAERVEEPVRVVEAKAAPKPGPTGDAPMCDTCGCLTIRNASCFRCLNCGNSMGCS